jgi:L-lactate dehydrogenase complex protein LldG
MPGSVIERFMGLAREEAATAERVAGLAQVPAAVHQYLQQQGLESRLKVVGLAHEDRIAWDDVPQLQCEPGPLAPDGDTVVTGCYGGVAEAGALVVLSAVDHPSEANFLAATHIVILHAKRLVDTFEALWARVRADFPGEMPRVLNFIVGPSRTADLGVPSKLGAHGPARVHIIVVDPESVSDTNQQGV